MHGSRQRRSRVVLVLAVAVIAALGIAAPRALAWPSYAHGNVADCEACHLYGHTLMIPTNEDCINCHTGCQVPDRSLTCWTCHKPGQNMGGARNDAACTAPCHLADGTTVTHVAHLDRPATCTLCHPVTTSPTDANESPHHAVPAPLIAGFVPGSGAVGSTVTLTGTRFTNAAMVSFNGSSAAFIVDSDTQITAAVPAGATSGPVGVITAGGNATSAASFTVVFRPTITLRLSGLTSGAAKLGRSVTAKGRVTPTSLAGGKVKLCVRLRKAGSWVTVKTVSVIIKAGGAYTRIFKPAKKGSYRVMASVGRTAVNTPARTAWIAFRVR